MRVLRALGVFVAVLVAQGCMATTVVLHVRPDGGGRATITSRLYLSGMRAFDGIFAEPGAAPPRPPNLAEELPPPGPGMLAQAFGAPVQLVSTRLDTAPDGGIRTTQIEFDDIRTLQMMFPPVVVAAGQHFSVAGILEPALMTFSIRPHENGDRLLVVKLPDPQMANRPDGPITEFKTDSREEQLFKQAIKNMSLQLFVEIEQPLLRTNAPRREGDRATLFDLNLDRMINAMDESRARRMLAPGSFQEMMWQIGDLPGAVVPVDREVFLEYEAPPEQAAPPAQPPPAPAPPDTEIYLAPLTMAGGTIAIGRPANITNNPGYDNQPFFTPDGRSILFTSVRGTSPGLRDAPLTQTDIYRYDIVPRTIARVTQTAEGEYSPTVMPDGTRISAITVEGDGTQRLYSIAPSGPKIQRDVLLPGVKPVGYHAWADDHTLALFILGADRAPATLQIADTRTGAARVAATDIGRSLQRMPGSGPARHISFVQRERRGDGVSLVIKELDAATGAITTLTAAVEGSREADLAWTPDGRLLMVKDDVLYAWTRGETGWKEVAKLQQLSLRGVTRLAVSPKGDFLALVAAAPAPSER